MHRITLVIILLFAATCADAAWYQKTDGTIVDPIQDIYGADHSYSGNNLEPNAYLRYANLAGADLTDAFLEDADLAFAYLRAANLSGADLRDAVLMYADLRYAYLNSADLTSANLGSADLWQAALIGADLSDANLRRAELRLAFLGNADLSGADLSGADLRSADLSGSDLSNVNYYNTTWTGAFYYTNNEPTWDSGMDRAWRTSVGILALAPTNAVPEPSTLLLALLGLALLPRKRQR